MTGFVHASVANRHRSREFVESLKRIDAVYTPATAIKVILDNHSAHISEETKAWLAEQPEGRFTFVFTPKHGSWLNLVEGFFSKLAGIVTFASFTCQPRDALMGRRQGNQWLGALHGGAELLQNPPFLANVTMPARALALPRPSILPSDK